MQKDLENLAKEMQNLSDVKGEFSSDKEFFLFQFLILGTGLHFHRFYPPKRDFVFALAKKLTEKSVSKSDFDSKKELVKKGIHSYVDFETSQREREQFVEIVCQKPETVVKASSKTSLEGRKLQRVHE